MRETKPDGTVVGIDTSKNPSLHPKRQTTKSLMSLDKMHKRGKMQAWKRSFNFT